MDRKLKIKITPETSGGEIMCYHLMLAHGDNNFSGVLIHSADQMRQVAAALVVKAGEIEKGLCDWCNGPIVESPYAIKAYPIINEFSAYHTRCFVVAHQGLLTKEDREEHKEHLEKMWRMRHGT